MTVATPAAAPRRLGPAAILGMMFNPGAVLEHQLEHTSLGAAAAVPGLAFGLFFLQSALDIHRIGVASLLPAVRMAATGLVYGAIGVPLVALAAWILALPFRGGQSIAWAVRAYCLAYCPALVYCLVGLGFSLGLHWNTAVSFGVTGALWAIGPMMPVNERLTGGRRYPALFLSTLCGGLVLLGWARLGTGG